jgi:5'-nucleotidase (lipoprotein e(P4) family)
VRTIATFGLCVAAACGCASRGAAPRASTSAAPPVATVVPAPYPANLHWFRDSAEQKALYTQVYREATSSARTLSRRLPPQSWAVIMDVDETILDDSEYEKRLALSGQKFDAGTWNGWIEERAAPLLPGAKAFVDTVIDELHGQVALITNRSLAQCPATEDNLKKNLVRYTRVLCDPVGDGNKNARFHKITEGEPGVAAPLNVLIWVGDNIQDFPLLTQADPGSLAQFGVHYFVLPNPMYGSWQKVTPR